MFSREARVRLFLAFLVLVLVLVNSQSLQLSYESRARLTESFEESLENRARLLAAGLSGWEDAPALARELEDRARLHGIRSACVLDWSPRLLTGGSCAPPAGGAFDRLDRDGRMRLVESGWATTGLAFPYDRDAAEDVGYLALATGDDPEEPRLVLRVVMAAPGIAETNRRFRSTLIYQISALSLVLLSVILFFQSLFGAHRKLVAEARSVATELSPADLPEEADEGQFLLQTFQEVVARLKEKEEELKALHLIEKARADETEALASDIIRSMTTGLVSLDPSGGVAVVNPAAERIFGVQASAARGKPFDEVFSGSPELGRMAAEALSKGTYHLRGQALYRVADGRVLHLGVSVIPLLSARGTTRGALCLLADLTEVVELRERLFLKENLARLGEMAAGIAHEFRNGLATIMGNARLLERATPAESEEIREALLSESQTLARVVAEFLQFARPEPLHLESVDLAALVSGLVEELSPRAAEAGIELSWGGERVSLEADELLLRKAIQNLVSNAIESVTAASTENGRVRIELEARDGFAVVRVLDNGPGVDPRHREKIFAPFFTLKERGTGLGLSVVQKIAVTHNGRVELEDRSRGASFVLRIPLEKGSVTLPQDWV
jgi:PAS domain S-box-containing protein